MPKPGTKESKTLIQFSQGLADNPDLATLSQGELSLATACEYRLGTPELHKEPGRTDATNAAPLASAILGIKRLQYNAGDDTFVAVAADGKIYEATPSAAMTFAAKMITKTFSGTGLNDLTPGGTNTDTSFAIYEIEITTAGTPDQFKWRKNQGSYTTGVSITGAAQTLATGVTVTFGATTGHTLADKWYVTAIPTQSTSAIPQFSTFRDRWMMVNGVDIPLVREPDAVPRSGGFWRPASLVRPAGVITAANITSAATLQTPDSNSGDMLNAANTVDEDPDTKGSMTVDAVDATDSHTWVFSTNNAVNNRGLYITHAGSSSYSAGGTTVSGRTPPRYGDLPPQWEDRDEGNEGSGSVIGTWLLEYKIGTGNWTEIFTTTGTSYSQRQDFIPIPDATNFSTSNLQVRYTITRTIGTFVSGTVWGVFVRNGRETSTNVTNQVFWGLTEVYTDSQGVEHESPMCEVSDKFAPGAAVSTYGATLTLSGITSYNPHAYKWRIYRSIDEEGGGFPFMYAIATIDKGTTVFVDDFEAKGLTTTLDKDKLYEFLHTTFADGAQIDLEANLPIPLPSLAVTFQGCMTFVPASVETQDRLYFSQPFSITAANGTKVPDRYYLRFETGENDQIVSAVSCNGGRSLIVYFTSGTQLVNYLPLSTDAGVFDQRVKEFVSKRRGCAGRLCATSFSPDEGVNELAAAVDSLGLWVTDGVNVLKNWTKDIDWSTHVGSADLSTAMLVDNPEMRRLEFIYNSTGSTWKRLLFYYGEMKDNGLPKITGPTTCGFRNATYSVIGGVWKGYTGDKTSSGYIWNERVGTSDAAQGSGSTSIAFAAETKDFYPYELEDGGLVLFLYIKWKEPSSSKTVTLTVTAIHDTSQATETVTKSYNVYTWNKAYVKKYGDRFRVKIADSSTTALPSLVGAELLTRKLAGRGRDQAS